MNWWRVLLYRWRHGHWCQHHEETGTLIDMGQRKMFICQGCGRVAFS